MKSILEPEFEFYLKHQDEFAQKYGGKFLVIKDCKLVGAFDTEIEAIKAGAKKFPLGTFLVQKCELGTESYTQTFHSRVLA